MYRYLFLLFIYLCVNLISCQDLTVSNITVLNELGVYSPFTKDTIFTIKVSFDGVGNAGASLNLTITTNSTVIVNMDKPIGGLSSVSLLVSGNNFFNGGRLYPQPMTINVFTPDVLFDLIGNVSTTMTFNSPYYQPGPNTSLVLNIVDNISVAKLGSTSWVGLQYITFNQINLYKYCYLVNQRDSKNLRKITFSYGESVNTLVFFPIPTLVSTETFSFTDLTPTNTNYNLGFNSAPQDNLYSYQVFTNTYGSYFYFVTNSTAPIGVLQFTVDSVLHKFMNPILYNDILGNFISYFPIKNSVQSTFTVSLGSSMQVITVPTSIIQVSTSTVTFFTGLGSLISKKQPFTKPRSDQNYYGAILTLDSPDIYLFDSIKILAAGSVLSETIPILTVSPQSIVVPLVATTSSLITIVGNYIGSSFSQNMWPTSNTYSQGSELNYPVNVESGIKKPFQGDYTPMVYFVDMDSISVDEMPFINTIQYGIYKSGYTLPFKTVPFEFPYRCSGYSTNITFAPLIPILPDTPSSNMRIKLSDTISNDLTMKFVNLTTDNLDLLHPIAKVVLTYDLDTSTAKTESLRVDIFDQIGIDNDRCFVRYGPYEFRLTTDLRYKGSNSGNQGYITTFSMNRYFCDQDISFECEDLRGSSVAWTSSELKGAISNFLIKFNKCESPLDGVKLVALKSSNYYESSTYYKAFQVDLFVPNSNQNDYSVTLYLDNQNGQNLYELFLYFNSTSNSFVNRNLFTNKLTQNCNYRLVITYQGKSMELTNSEIRYINKVNPMVDVSVLLVESSFKGFSFYGGQISITNIANIYYLKLLQVADFSRVKSISYILISSLNPYPVVGTIAINSTESYSYSIMSTPTENHRLYVDTLCDFGNNCITYPTHAFSTPLNPPGALPTKSNMLSATYALSTSKSSIDVTSENRKVIFTLQYDGGFQLLTSTLPTLYLVERFTLSKLKIPFDRFVQSGSRYTFIANEFEIPLNWGFNGLESISVYGVLNSVGQFEGYEIPTNTFTLVHKSGPVVWSTFLNSSTPEILYINGANLGLAEYPEHAFSIYQPGKPNITNLNFNPLTPTKGFIRLKKNTVLQSDSYLIVASNPTPIPLFIVVCMNPTCSNNGDCIDGECKCDDGWGGVDCSINLSYQCKNNCSSNGQCVIMNCNCNPGYMGPSCETKIVDNNQVIVTVQPNNTTPVMTFHQFSSNTSTDTTTSKPSTSDTVLSEESKKTNFTVLLTKIEEFDYRDNLKYTYDLLGKWTLKSFNSSAYVYTMPLSVGSMLTVIVEMTNSESKTIEFANTTITIPSNSIKYYIKLENYTFQSTLNHLTYTWEANYKSPNPCETQAQKIQYGGSNLNDIHYIIIPANQLQLYGRFSNSIILDGNILMASNQAQVLKDTVTIKVSTPYFRDQVELDPDFSVLVSLNSKVTNNDKEIEYDEQCNPISVKSDGGLPKYAIPVIIVGGIAVVVILLSVIFTTLYKKNMAFRLKVLSIKQFSRSKSSKSLKMNKI